MEKIQNINFTIEEGYIDFNAKTTSMPELGHLVENAVLNQQLMQQVKRIKNIDLYLSDSVNAHELSESGVKAELSSGHLLEAQAIIAADGALSTLRTENAFETVEWDYGHSAIVTTIEIKKRKPI